MKQKISDFLCAAVITMGILMCLALVSGTSAFDEALTFDKQQNTVDFLGVSFVINDRAFCVANDIFMFNDNLFGKGFTSKVKIVVRESSELFYDTMKIAFGLSKKIVGAQ